MDNRNLAWKNSLWATALLLVSALAGCGFELKGTANTDRSTSLDGIAVMLVSSQPRGELTAAVAKQLQLEGAAIAGESPAEQGGRLVLRLGEERFQQRNLSLTAQARSATLHVGSLNRSRFASATKLSNMSCLAAKSTQPTLQ